MNTTEHFNRVKEFMEKAGQLCPQSPIVPSEGVRLLRAKLIYEEAMELIDALGFNVLIDIGTAAYRLEDTKLTTMPLDEDAWSFVPHSRGPNLVEIADGCADVSVVTIGTLVACGIDDDTLLWAVDQNNLEKFDPPVCSICGSCCERVDDLWRCLSIGNVEQCATTYPLSFGGHRSESGKWKKGTSHQPPKISKILQSQGAREEDLNV